MKRTVSPQEMQDLGRALEHARQQGLLSQEEVNVLHARFIAEDAAGTQWTIGIRSLQWHKRVSGKWTAGQPPQQLQLEMELLLILQALKSSPPQASRTGAAPAAGPATCSGCGAVMQEGQKFCPNCGARASAPSPPPPPRQPLCENPACRSPLAGNEMFCPNCGQRRSPTGAAPASAAVPPTPPTPVAPTPPPPPAPAVRRCPRCGKAVAPHLRFCTADGTPVP